MESTVATTGPAIPSAQASDLRYSGYKRIDVLRIYGFNLILLGVNLAGTFSSIVQGITASKATFARTPKPSAAVYSAIARANAVGGR